MIVLKTKSDIEIILNVDHISSVCEINGFDTQVTMSNGNVFIVQESPRKILLEMLSEERK